MTGHELLKSWRRGREISQATVAEAVGVTQATVSDWELGNKQPTIESALKLEQYSGKAIPVASWVPATPPIAPLGRRRSKRRAPEAS